MKPKVTIGICGRNCESIVGFAIESVALQDFPHELMEILFVDDGSEDNTVKVAEGYLSKTDIRWKIFSDRWRGLGRARNIVINNASGNFIIWVDSDELLSHDFVRRQIRTIEQNPDVGIVTGRLSILDGESFLRALDLMPLVIDYSRQEWRNEKLPGTGGTTYRVVAARQVTGFDEDLQGLGEDIDIAIRIRNAGWRIVRSEGVFYERHAQLSSWVTLVNMYIRQGFQSRKLYRKKGRFFSFSRMNPVSSTVAGVIYAVRGYQVTRRKIVVFLPFQFSLKMLAWFYGFCMG